MLCASCHRQLMRGGSVCPSCGAPVDGAAAPPIELLLDDGTRIAVVGELTIGRAPGSDLRLDDPSVSRRHARIVAGNGSGPRLEDSGSSYGTFVNGDRLTGAAVLRDGTRIQLGDRAMVVHRRRSSEEAGRTMVVPVGASLLIPAVGEPRQEPGVAESVAHRPRLRSGHRIKRLPAAEGPQRWVIEDSVSGALVRLSDQQGELLGLLDGATALPELVAEADRVVGPEGPAVLAQLLVELGERGLLAGVDSGAHRAGKPTGLRRLLTPRSWSTRRAGPVFERAYRCGGWVLFTRPSVVVLAAIGLLGLVAELVLIGWRYGSPFVVASHLGLGGLVFFSARVLLVAAHETAHGLMLASYGRRVPRAGIKLILIFPYAFVDTSESWFEPKRRRIAVSLAGPASDLVWGGGLALLCLTLPAGAGRDVLFQAAFAAYVGALFNLNPFLDRDGYHVIVDLLGRPRLRERARAEFARRLSGQGRRDDDPALGWYAVAGLGWSLVMAAFVIFLSLQYRAVMGQFIPAPVIWVGLITIWIALLIPVVVTLLPPLMARRTARKEAWR